MTEHDTLLCAIDPSGRVRSEIERVDIARAYALESSTWSEYLERFDTALAARDSG